LIKCNYTVVIRHTHKNNITFRALYIMHTSRSATKV